MNPVTYVTAMTPEMEEFFNAANFELRPCACFKESVGTVSLFCPKEEDLRLIPHITHPEIPEWGELTGLYEFGVASNVHIRGRLWTTTGGYAWIQLWATSVFVPLFVKTEYALFEGLECALDEQYNVLYV